MNEQGSEPDRQSTRANKSNREQAKRDPGSKKAGQNRSQAEQRDKGWGRTGNWNPWEEVMQSRGVWLSSETTWELVYGKAENRIADNENTMSCLKLGQESKQKHMISSPKSQGCVLKHLHSTCIIVVFRHELWRMSRRTACRLFLEFVFRTWTTQQEILRSGHVHNYTGISEAFRWGVVEQVRLWRSHVLFIVHWHRRWNLSPKSSLHQCLRYLWALLFHPEMLFFYFLFILRMLLLKKPHQQHPHSLAVNSPAVFSQDTLQSFHQGAGRRKCRASPSDMCPHIQALRKMLGDSPEFSACLKAA